MYPFDQLHWITKSITLEYFGGEEIIDIKGISNNIVIRDLCVAVNLIRLYSHRQQRSNNTLQMILH